MTALFNSLRWWKTSLFILLVIACVMCYFPYSRVNKDEANTLHVTCELSTKLPVSITVDPPFNESRNTAPVIAIGSAITSRKLHNVSETNLGIKFQFFYAFLPSFCNTASPYFIYKIYLAFDENDTVFTNHLLYDAFKRHFYLTTTAGSCGDRHITVILSLVKCDYTGKPAWAQNDAMIEAYIDHSDYFYRINDDTKLLTRGWTEKFILQLENYDPPRVGVVGPQVIGNRFRILTYEFVHRTHIDIFGFYYPHEFTDWYADKWMTFVYKPRRSTELFDVRLIHTRMLGRRYDAHSNMKILLGHHVAKNTAIINR